MTINSFAFYPHVYGHLVWKEPIVQCKDHSTHKSNFPWLEVKKNDYISSEVEIFFDLAILESKGFKSPPLRGRVGWGGWCAVDSKSLACKNITCLYKPLLSRLPAHYIHHISIIQMLNVWHVKLIYNFYKCSIIYFYSYLYRDPRFT